MNLKQIEIMDAVPEDAAVIHDIQIKAYTTEARLYDDYSIPPLKQTVDDVLREMETQCVLKAVSDGKIIGSVRAREDDGTCYIGKLIVLPELHDRGAGTALMRAIEERFPDVRRFELFTGSLSERNLHLYEKLGYKVFKKERVDEKLTHVFLEKTNAT